VTLAPLLRLDGRRALVTGAARGMGRAIAEVLAEFGADVAVHDVDAASCAGTVAAVRGFGRRSVAIGAPFGEPDAVARTVGAADAALGPIDILVSTVAVQTRTAYDRVTGEDFDRTVAINLAAFLDLVQRTAPGMVSRGWGRILAVGSVQQVRPHPEMIVYAATKAAQANMVRNLARQFAASGVTVNNLAPGVFATERNAAALADPVYRAKVLDAIPARAFADPIDIAGAALLLCSDAGRYVTGADVPVDGGLGLP
jgi:glucose 1-dehydrogenase